MAKLTAKARKKIPSAEFALPKERKYPIQDRSHAANAKARAQQQYDEGNISKGTLKKIDSKANKVLKATSPKKSTTKKPAAKKTAASKPRSKPKK